MKKILLTILAVLVVLVLLAALSIHLFLDSAVKRGVEVVGPKLTKTEVKVDSVSLSLLSGSGTVKNFVLGNPEGFKSPSAIQAGLTKIALQPRSIFGSKVVINTIDVQSPEITFESNLKSLSLNSVNLKQILANLEESTGSTSEEKTAPNPPQPEAKAGKKLQVDDFRITGGKIHLSALGQTETVPLPEIHLTNLGTGPEGITPAELAKVVLKEIVSAAEKQSGSFMGDLGKGGKFLSGGTNSNAASTVEKSLGNLFKKKK